MFKPNNVRWLAAAVLMLAAFLVIPSSAVRADGPFSPQQQVRTTRGVTAYQDPCGLVSPSGSDYRGAKFEAKKGETLTVTPNESGEYRTYCERRGWAIRVANATGKIGWVYEFNLALISTVTSTSPNVVGKFIWGTVTNSILQAVGSDVRIEYHPSWGWAPRKPGLGD